MTAWQTTRTDCLSTRTAWRSSTGDRDAEDQLADAKAYGAEFGRLLLADLRPIQRAPKGKVRCDVCGAVFDEDEPVCPICNDTGYHAGGVCRCLRAY